jgi:hypothetical protein
MKKFVFGKLFFSAFILSAVAVENASNTIIFNRLVQQLMRVNLACP